MKTTTGLAAMAAALLTFGPAAASTRFDITFTGKTASLGAAAGGADGTGYILVDGYTGSGLELFGGADPARTIVGFQVNLALASFGPGNTPTSYPTLTVNDGLASDFNEAGYLIGAPPPAPSIAVFNSLGPGAYQLLAGRDLYTGTYTLTRYVPPPPTETDQASGPSPVSAVPEPSAWALMAAGFFGLGGALRLERRQRRAAQT